MNLKLPACVYVPFTKSTSISYADSNQYYNVLNIVVE